MSAPAPSLDTSLGSVELGILVSTALCGMVIVQCYTYYNNGFEDGKMVKAVVSSVVLIETFHTVLLWIYLYILTVTYFGDRDKLEVEYWALRVSNPVTSIVTWTVQSFFAVRIYRLSRMTLYCIMSCTLSAVHLAGGFAILVLTGSLTIPQFSEKYQWLLVTNWCITAVVDIGNTIALCWCLFRARPGSPKRSQSMIDELILWTIETGLLTSIAVIIMVILLVSLPKNNFVFMFFYCVKAKLYSNSLLASLNNRKKLRARNSCGENSHIELSNMDSNRYGIRRPIDVRVDVVETRLVENLDLRPAEDSKYAGTIAPRQLPVDHKPWIDMT